MKDPYRSHSVWFDVFGVVAVIALLLAPLGFLASEMVGGRGAGGGGMASAGKGVEALRQPRSAISQREARRSAPPAYSAPNPSRHRGRPSPANMAVPFSKSWRAEATPDLSGGGALPGSRGGNAGSSSGRFSMGADPGPTHSRDGETVQSRENTGGSETGWRAEAQRFAGQARALSGQFGQMAQRSEGNATSETSTEGQRAASTTRGASAKAENPGLPESPTVPIDDHLHWLLATGVIWGMWRVWRGG